MKKLGIAKVVLAVSMVAACVLGLAACSNSKTESAVAATVNGTPIAEQDVTDQIQSIREQSGLADEDAWGDFLAQSDMTPSSVREQIIDTMASQQLVMQGAADLGVTVESSEVDEYVESMKANYDDDDAWNTALEQAGFTEDSYRKVIEESLYEQKVSEHFEETTEVTDEDNLSAAQMYASYYDGAKRSSHILFSVEDPNDEAAVAAARAQAEEVLAQINAGTLDFAEAAKQYSGDTGSAEKGGDVGWDVMSQFVSEYTEALSGLELNQVSEPVVSQYGVHLIKVTEVFTAPEEVTSLDQIPAEMQESIKQMASSVASNNAYTAWLDELKEKAEIVINDMPSGLPYDIDLTKYLEALEEENAESGDTTSAETSTEAATDSESAASTDAASAEATSTDAASTDSASTETTDASSDASASSNPAGTAGSSGTANE